MQKGYEKLKKEYNKTRAYFDNVHDSMTNVWEYPIVVGEEREGHPTPKPVKMIGRLIKTSCPWGGLVVDPFGGTGTTLIACEQLDRVCFMLEIAEKYCDVIVRRWEKLTGREAVLENTK